MSTEANDGQAPTELSELRAEVTAMRADLREIRELIEVARRPHPVERPDEMVGVEYVAHLFGCSVSSTYMGKAGTKGVRWTSRRPLRCPRSEAHAALARWTNEKLRRVPSLVRRKPRA